VQKNEEPRRSTEISGARVTVEEETFQVRVIALVKSDCPTNIFVQIRDPHIFLSCYLGNTRQYIPWLFEADLCIEYTGLSIIE
jgi:hypothetical protein